MSNSDYIAVAGVLATVLGILVTWLVMKKQFASKKLSYAIRIEPLLLKRDAALERDLKIFYQGEELPEPALLSMDIVNIGLSAVEEAKLTVKLPGPTYLIPGYFQDIPEGYDSLWDIERTDAEECLIRFKHINPKQTARIRLLMDEVPKGEPSVSCPMPNVEIIKATRVELSTIARLIIELFAPAALPLVGGRK